MKLTLQISILSLLSFASSCSASTTEKEIAPIISYVTYGYYCGECTVECTKMYNHFLKGFRTTFWTDTTDSYFSDDGLKFETKMTREAEKIGFEIIDNIPDQFLKTESARNIFGCPDCNDGCGLYFEFLLSEFDSKPIVFEMEYDLSNTSGEIKEFGELIKSTISKLERYR